MRYAKCVDCNGMVGWVGLLGNLLLSSLKLFVGLVAGSHALIVDSLYSAKDVISSLLIIVGLKISKAPVDREHPFGHGKVEFILSVMISIILIGVTGMLLLSASSSLVEGAHRPPHLVALWTAALSVCISYYLYSYMKCVARELNSPIVNTLSRHQFADGEASFAVVIGIIGSHYLGMPWLDTVVAIGEALSLLYLGGSLFWEGFKGLLDSSAPQEVMRLLRMETMRVEGVLMIDSLRTRLVGQELCVDVVVGVDPDLPISQADTISQQVIRALGKAIPHLGDVNVHFKSPPGTVPEMDALREEIFLLTGKSKPKSSSVVDDEL